MIKLENATYQIVENRIKDFKYKIKIKGKYKDTWHEMEIRWVIGDNSPEEVLELAKEICGRLS